MIRVDSSFAISLAAHQDCVVGDLVQDDNFLGMCCVHSYKIATCIDVSTLCYIMPRHIDRILSIATNKKYVNPNPNTTLSSEPSVSFALSRPWLEERHQSSTPLLASGPPQIAKVANKK